MGTDAMGYVLTLTTIGMSMIASRNRNMLFTIGTVGLWIAFLGFIIANNIAGSAWISNFIIAAYAIIAAFCLITFVSKKRQAMDSDVPESPSTSEEIEERRRLATGNRGLMDMNNAEYRATARRALYPNRRGR